MGDYETEKECARCGRSLDRWNYGGICKDCLESPPVEWVKCLFCLKKVAQGVHNRRFCSAKCRSKYWRKSKVK